MCSQAQAQQGHLSSRHDLLQDGQHGGGRTLPQPDPHAPLRPQGDGQVSIFRITISRFYKCEDMLADIYKRKLGRMDDHYFSEDML